MEKPVLLSKYIQIACLNTNDVKRGITLVSGWGRTETGARSRYLRAVELDFVPMDKCVKYWSGGLSDGMICAHGKNKDSCNGDSGGKITFIMIIIFFHCLSFENSTLEHLKIGGLPLC